MFSTLRRAGVRAKYQRHCRHALYGRGCGLDIAAYCQTGTVTAVATNAITIPVAAEQPDGWYRGGVLRFRTQLGFITGHAGAVLTLLRPMSDLAAALAAPELDSETGDPLPVLVDIAPDCDLRAATSAEKFGNLLNFGGFPEIPGRNPFGGGSIVRRAPAAPIRKRQSPMVWTFIARVVLGLVLSACSSPWRWAGLQSRSGHGSMIGSEGSDDVRRPASRDPRRAMGSACGDNRSRCPHNHPLPSQSPPYG